MRMAVVGGRGVVGKHVVQAAETGGHDVVVVGRRNGVDARTGEGLSEALKGVDVIIDATNSGTTNRARATAFFTEVTGRLHSMGSQQGVSGLVTLSIVGLERVPGYGYYRAKLAQEAAALAGPLPTTIVRATQFHEFPAQILTRLRRGPVALMPVMRIQPVAARSVGEVLVEAAIGPPSGATIEVAGPGPQDLVSMARSVLVAQRVRASVIPLPLPGRAGKAMRSGGQLPLSGARVVGPTFEEWLSGDDLSLVY